MHRSFGSCLAADPVRRVTIVPYGRALGLTEQRPGEESTYWRVSPCCLGGRTAEDLVLGNIPTAAENDPVAATHPEWSPAGERRSTRVPGASKRSTSRAPENTA